MTEKNLISSWLADVPEPAHDECLGRLNQVADLLISRKIQFLCGAGMSKKSGLKLAEDLTKRMIGEILEGKKAPTPSPEYIKAISSKFPFEAIAEAYLRETDQSRLRQLIIEETGSGTGIVHSGHEALEYFAGEEWIDRIYTTNFDDLLERAFRDRSKPLTDRNADELPVSLRRQRIPVIHLHGAASEEADCLLAESQTYALSTPLAHFMMADMVSNWFVWVGYGLADVDLRTIYLSTQSMLRRKGLVKNPYVVHPLESKGDDRKSEWRLADKVWKARGVVFIPGKAEDFLPALQAQARRTLAQSLARKIIKAQRGDPSDAEQINAIWEKARTLSVRSRLGNEIDAMRTLAREFGIDEKAL